MSCNKKIRRSRNRWKQKAIERSDALREARKKDRRQSATIGRLKEAAHAAQTEQGVKVALPTNSVTTIANRDTTTRVVCVLLVIQATVSFRSVPRILLTVISMGLMGPMWVPHFSSVINWTLRVGLARLQSIQAVSERWIAIIDTSIDVGVRKALVVLRVPLDALSKRGDALCLADCECIGVEIAARWTGESVADVLQKIFAVSGHPAAILKDQGGDLMKGVRLWRQRAKAKSVVVIGDVGHMIANLLKAQFAKTKPFKKFLAIVRSGSSQLRQTEFADLIAPKVRTKGRFQGIGRVAEWAEKILGLIGGQGRAPNGSVTARLRRAFAGLSTLRAFLVDFASTCLLLNEFLKLMKKQGLNQKTYIQGKEILQGINNLTTRQKAIRWLDQTLSSQCRLSMAQTPLAVSSDIIETLMGQFKIVIQRTPDAELNRLVLAMPTLCGNNSSDQIQRNLAKINHVDLLKWERVNVPETMRQSRRRILTQVNSALETSPKTGKAS